MNVSVVGKQTFNMGAICGGVLKEQSANRLGRRIRKDNTRDTRKSPIEERASIQSR